MTMSKFLRMFNLYCQVKMAFQMFALFLIAVVSPVASHGAMTEPHDPQTSTIAAVPFHISGKVQNTDGAGIEGASLQLFNYAGDRNLSARSALAETTSSVAGDYALVGAIDLSDNNSPYVMLQVRKDGYVRLLHVIYKLVAASQNGFDVSAVHQDVILPVEAVIEGVLINETGGPFPGIALQGYAGEALQEGVVAETANTTSSASGYFKLEGLPEGKVVLSARRGERTLLNTSTTAPVSGLRLQVSTAGSTIIGMVALQDGTPIPNAEVLLQRATELSSSEFQAGKVDSLVADGQGRFFFINLAAGSYKLIPSAENLRAVPQEDSENFGFFPLASAETTSGIQLKMYNGTTINGTVREAGTGKVLSEVIVSVESPGINASGKRAVTGRDGTYMLEGVFPDSSDDARLYVLADGYVLGNQMGENECRGLEPIKQSIINGCVFQREVLRLKSIWNWCLPVQFPARYMTK